MKRKQHYIKGNLSCEMPSDVVWCDTETTGVKINNTEEKHVLNFGFAIARRRIDKNNWTKTNYFRFETITEFWDYVESRLHGKCKLYVMAHNWAFDGPVLDLFNELPRRNFTLLNCVIQSPPIIMRFRRGQQTIVILDTLNIWRMPLDRLGESIGINKLPMPSKDANAQVWDTYCKRDVRVIMEATINWIGFLQDNDLGGFAPTLAAQAFRTYRHRFMRHKILIDDSEKASSVSRNALHGGRVECFYIGKVPDTVYKLDINSQYPSIMLSQQLPHKLIGFYKRVSVNELESWLQHYCVCAHVVLNTREPVYPKIYDNKLVFPIGVFNAYLSTPELIHAIKNGHVHKVLECAVYEKNYLFKDYVEFMYKKRLGAIKAGDDVQAGNYKILMNALYGKFAQKGLIYDKVSDTPDNSVKVWTEFDAVSGTTFNMRQYCGIVEQLQRETESRDSFPAISAHVSAYGRMQLYNVIAEAEINNCFYCDTDCVLVNKQGFDNLQKRIDPTKLGFLKLEGVHNYVLLYGPKDYQIDDTIRIKGIRKNARAIGKNLYEQVKFHTINGLLRRGDLSAPIVSTITKKLHRVYNKGVVLDNGVVKPLLFSNNVLVSD